MPKKHSNIKPVIIIALIISMVAGGFVLFYATRSPVTARWITPEQDLQAVYFIQQDPVYLTNLVTETFSTEGYSKIEFRLYEHINALNTNDTPKYLYAGSAYVESSATFIGGTENIYYALPDGELNVTQPFDISIDGDMGGKTVRWYWNATVQPDAYYFCMFVATHNNGESTITPGIYFTTVHQEFYPDVTLLKPVTGVLTPLNDTFEVRVLIVDNIQGLGQNTTQSVYVAFAKDGLDSQIGYGYYLEQQSQGIWALNVSADVMEMGEYEITIHIVSSDLALPYIVTFGSVAIQSELQGTPSSILPIIMSWIPWVLLGIVAVIGVLVLIKYLILPRFSLRLRE